MKRRAIKLLLVAVIVGVGVTAGLVYVPLFVR
jgi:hypothetical protein